LTNAAITYPFVIFFLCTFWNVVFFYVVSQINVVTAAVQADNKLDLASLARLQRWWTAYLWRFRHFTFDELRLSVWRRKGRIENASVLFFKFALGSDRAGRSTWSTQRRGRH
jgi:hypothetical protein